MKLRVIEINGHIALVDESAKGRMGANINLTNNKLDYLSKNYEEGTSEWNFLRLVVMADPKLNLDVPILPNWRELEVEQSAKPIAKSVIEKLEKSGRPTFTDDSRYGFINGFIASCNHSKAKKYTEEDLRKAIEFGRDVSPLNTKVK